MKYKVLVQIRRLVKEVYECEVEEDNPEDACDLVYEHFTTFPDSEYQLISRRCLKTDTEMGPARLSENEVKILDIEHNRTDEPSNDDDPEPECA